MYLGSVIKYEVPLYKYIFLFYFKCTFMVDILREIWEISKYLLQPQCEYMYNEQYTENMSAGKKLKLKLKHLVVVF